MTYKQLRQWRIIGLQFAPRELSEAFYDALIMENIYGLWPSGIRMYCAC